MEVFFINSPLAIKRSVRTSLDSLETSIKKGSPFVFVYFYRMDRRWVMLFILLAVAELAFSQAPGDSSFSVLFNNSVSFTHAHDERINRWLSEYGYAAEPRVPSSLNFELAATPVSSRLMYSVKLSVITDGHNFTSFNILGGLYSTLVKTRTFWILAGGGAGYHNDILALNGDMPPAYKLLATQYNRQLCLHRTGLFMEPALRAFWFPISYHNVQIGLFGGLGYDLEFNSRWKLGYYDSNRGKYNHFKNLTKPSDQQRVSEYGISYNLGISLHLNLQ
jgi:hypothetical protein